MHNPTPNAQLTQSEWELRTADFLIDDGFVEIDKIPAVTGGHLNVDRVDAGSVDFNQDVFGRSDARDELLLSQIQTRTA